jgi:hypothetical protein
MSPVLFPKNEDIRLKAKMVGKPTVVNCSYQVTQTAQNVSRSYEGDKRTS